MKTLKTASIAAALLLTTIGTATAGSVPGVTQGINYSVNDGVATISGHFDSGIERYLAAQYVNGLNGVDQVIDLATSN